MLSSSFGTSLHGSQYESGLTGHPREWCRLPGPERRAAALRWLVFSFASIQQVVGLQSSGCVELCKQLLYIFLNLESNFNHVFQLFGLVSFEGTRGATSCESISSCGFAIKSAARNESRPLTSLTLFVDS